ncbi:hypothetical protein Bpfe_004946, partial [Biomphalaria pfeifferi]
KTVSRKIVLEPLLMFVPPSLPLSATTSVFRTCTYIQNDTTNRYTLGSLVE